MNHAEVFLLHRRTDAIRGLLLSLALAVFGVAVLMQASIMEDAYITYRVIDNAVQGYGLRWNISERVQPYTHPLWMLMHIPFYALWENIYAISLLLGLACTAVCIALTMRTFPLPALPLIVLGVLPLTLSRSFTIYSTSGFENALMHALFAWFGWAVLRAPKEKVWLHISLATSLSLATRLDLALFYGVLWLYLLVCRWPDVRWKQVTLGMLPILAWEAFSLFYYGFLFPNTKYAKLNTGIDPAHHIALGWKYLLNFLVVDSVSALWTIAALLSLPFLARRFRRGDETAGFFLFLGIAILLSALYVVAVGGTYLTGRFLTLNILASVWLVLGSFAHRFTPKQLMAIAALACLVKLATPPPETIHDRCPDCFAGVDLPKNEDKIMLATYSNQPETLPRPRVNGADRTNYPIAAGSIGKFGYGMLPQVMIVDPIALSDPLLARLPCRIDTILSTGILPRHIPDGYMRAVADGNRMGMDPDLAAYYGKLRLIVAGDLWSKQRLLEIVKFNLGEYDHLRDRYVETMKAAKRQ